MEKKKKAAAAGARIDTAEISQKWDVKEIPEDIKEGVEKIEELLKGASAAKDAMEKKKKAAAAGARIDTAEISQKWGQVSAPACVVGALVAAMALVAALVTP